MGLLCVCGGVFQALQRLRPVRFAGDRRPNDAPSSTDRTRDVQRRQRALGDRIGSLQTGTCLYLALAIMKAPKARKPMATNVNMACP
jgi:hypothetical protein